MIESVVEKKGFATHSEGDLSDKFELESECLQEKVVDCVPVMKMECPDQRSLWKPKGVIASEPAECLHSANKVAENSSDCHVFVAVVGRKHSSSEMFEDCVYFDHAFLDQLNIVLLIFSFLFQIQKQ